MQMNNVVAGKQNGIHSRVFKQCKQAIAKQILRKTRKLSSHQSALYSNIILT